MMSEHSLHIIQASTKQTYQACLGIRMQVFVKEQQVPLELEVDTFEQEATHFLGQLDGRAVATGRYRVYGANLKFERIATLPAYRGKGIGKKLMHHMQACAQKNHPTLLPMMYAQADAITFYQQLGWICEGPEFLEANIKHKKMIFHHV
ncbi:MAG: GNAT family N-acetyltransferase [Bdellovibrionota bacterium]